VIAPDAYLNARVDDAFNALRLRVIDLAGLDVLGELDDAFWRFDRLPEVGQPRQNWHYAGRAFALRRNLISQGNPTPIVVVREDSEVDTYWRIYIRVNEGAQNGTLGEPLRQIPWNFDARVSEDVEAYEQGGKLMSNPPGGYYVDFTQLAADYGWFRIPAGRAWRQNFSEVLFWDFVKADGLAWLEAMRELYTDAQLAAVQSGATQIPATAIPEVTEEPSATETPRRTATPLPPDLQSGQP
jgi:TolB protein